MTRSSGSGSSRSRRLRRQAVAAEATQQQQQQRSRQALTTVKIPPLMDLDSWPQLRTRSNQPVEAAMPVYEGRDKAWGSVLSLWLFVKPYFFQGVDLHT